VCKGFEHWRGYLQVLVASDAIGMGVNLNIRRVLFHSLMVFKSKNQGLCPLDPAQIKQIAGELLPLLALPYSMRR
jgi:replicative superfamily II helicase